jgi:1,4-alpha-glucan branching enzyme
MILLPVAKLRRSLPPGARLLWLGTVLLLALLAGCEPASSPLEPAPTSGDPLPGQDDGASGAAGVAAADSFLLRAYGAEAVHLAGSVNGWAQNDPDWALVPAGDDVTWNLVAELPSGLVQYKYVLDDGATTTWLTDPRAIEVMPDGFSGSPAYWNAVRGRAFSTPRPLPSPPERQRLVIYEVSVNDVSATGTFAGLFSGLTSGADLVDLGINAIELMPVTVPSYNGWGYDPVLYFAPNPSFGWPSTFALLIDAAHERGIAVILDMVLNHAAGDAVLRQLDTFSGEYHFTTTESNPWGLVELNWSDPALRAHILDALCHWVDTYRVDGFRFDYIAGEPYATWVWLKDQLRARYPGLLLIAEDFAYASTGNAVTNGYDAQWGGNHTDGWGGGGNNFNQVMITALTERGFAWRGETVPTVGAWGTIYRNMWAVANVISGNAGYSGGVPGDGFSDVKYLESHDENRLVWAVDTYGAAGAQSVGGLTKAHLGALALMTTVGIPMLYNGQEIGADEYRPASPTLHTVDWSAGDQDLRDAYRHLIRLRLRHPALASENIFFQWRDDLVDQQERTMVYWRGETTDPAAAAIVAALNFDHDDHAWTIPFPAAGNWFRFYPISGALQPVTVPPGGLTLTIPASSGMLWIREDGVTGVPE